jgi:hypothetical protein
LIFFSDFMIFALVALSTKLAAVGKELSKEKVARSADGQSLAYEKAA